MGVDDHAEYVTERVRLAVAGGYDPPEQIVEDLTELIEYDPDAEEYVASLAVPVGTHVEELVAKAMAEHLTAEESFPPETDHDRLTRVFDDLRSSGILAEEDVGMTMSDVRGDMWQSVRQEQDDGRNARGWVAFHRQDVERVIDTGVLFVAFAAVTDEDEDFRRIGTEVADAFRDAGFTVSWDGDPNRRVELLEVVWQRRRGPGA